MATADKMLQHIKQRGLSLPEWGTGSNGKILNSDLERVLANDSLEQMACNGTVSWGLTQRMRLEEVMLAYRYDKAPEDLQQYAMEDDNEWVAEEKYNGCRMIITYHPNEGFRAFGRNRSRLTYLPIDYSTKILLNGRKRLCDVKPRGVTEPFIADCELLTGGYVETQSGSFTGNTLNAAVAVLQLNDEESHLAQKTTAPLYCVMFDALRLVECVLLSKALGQSFKSFPLTEEMLIQRITRRACLCSEFNNEYRNPDTIGFFQDSVCVKVGKKAFLEGLLAQGKEGVILKNLQASYVPGVNGFRDRTACLKVKRTMQGSFGDEIDAYVIGFTNGPEWDKKDSIAGLKLAVKLRTKNGTLKEHWIATVSGIPDEVRAELSEYSCHHYRVEPTGEIGERGLDGHRKVLQPVLRDEFYGKVLTIDGMDISARNRRISHAKADWGRGFRTDKDASQCIMDETFIDSQMF